MVVVVVVVEVVVVIRHFSPPCSLQVKYSLLLQIQRAVPFHDSGMGVEANYRVGNNRKLADRSKPVDIFRSRIRRR